MAILNKGQTFSDGEQVTSAKLNTAVDGATFAPGAVDDVSTQLSGGAIIVKDGGVGTAKITDNAVTSAKILDSNVTKGKIENVANMKVLGNTSGSSAAPQEVSILDEDDMTSDSNTSIPTQQSVKAYVDSLKQYQLKYSGSTGVKSATTSFVDWDLSSIVGTNRAMVIIEIWNASIPTDLLLKTKGSPVNPYVANSYSGWGASGAVVSPTNIGGTFIIVTDSSGVIELKATTSASSINYKIQAYQKLA